MSYSCNPMQERIYLDWNATTPLRREAREAMAAAWDLAGNPESIHAAGARPRGPVRDGRPAGAAAGGCWPRRRILHSDGT